MPNLLIVILNHSHSKISKENNTDKQTIQTKRLKDNTCLSEKLSSEFVNDCK